eukprot:1639806-Pleurochrysis_carterae.AAC.2
MALPLERRPVDKESRIPTSLFHELAVGLARALVKHQGLWVGQREQKCQHRRKRLATEALDAILELAPRIQALHADERRQVSDVIALHPLEPANEVKVHLGGGLLVSLGDGGMVALGGGAAPRADAADGRLDRGGYVGARRLALLALQQRVAARAEDTGGIKTQETRTPRVRGIRVNCWHRCSEVCGERQLSLRPACALTESMSRANMSGAF